MLPERITIGDKYGPAMEMTDPAEAAAYFEECVAHNMWYGKRTRAEAEAVERANLGYYAGYYDHETRLRVEKLFGCSHPVFGAATNGRPDPGAAFAAGVVAARG
jgi:hypothetical protein